MAKYWVKTPDAPAGQERSRGLKFGLVLGALIPDVDFFLLGPLFLVNSSLALKMHRTFTHSFFTTVLVVTVIWLVARSRASDYLKGFALGLGGGILSHMLLDILVWFGGIQAFWPLGQFGVADIHLWRWLKAPHVVTNLLGAADYLAFGLYYLFLAAAAKRTGTSLGFLGRLKLFTRLQWAFLVVYGALAFFLSGFVFDIAHYAAFILVFFPICLYVTVKMRETIHAL
jgi:membrane-bound metal-dependent hydrolase YbcI (DUF457 family)